MIVSYGIGRGGSGAAAMWGWTSGSGTPLDTLSAIQLHTLAPLRAMVTQSGTMYSGMQTLLSPNGSKK